uniref:Zinc metalloproteinase n=2 Tax=Strongyloides stercoralis TaxID=6248 RepID=A0A0K0E403_STRER
MNFIITIFLLSLSICMILGDNNQNRIKNDSDLESIERRVKKSVVKNVPFKWLFPIDYFIEDGVNADTITKGLKTLERETCIRFRKTDNFYRGGIVYRPGVGCISFIGKVSNNVPQEIQLSNECDIVTAVIHETSHALGVIHEMTRHDRNNYIDILYQNINPGVRFNFNIENLDGTLPYGTKYDYGSVMHYNRLAGSNNGRVVMSPKLNGYLKTIGQTTEYGFNDAKRLNMHYCNHKCVKKLVCANGGYTNPNNCKVCKCPRMFRGVLCALIKPSDKSCGITKYTATNNYKFIKTKGKKSCYYQITAPRSYRIRLTINNLNVADSFVCQPGSGLEIKYLADKTVSGAMLCGKHNARNFISKNNIIVMRYVGKSLYDSLSIKFKSFK